ncbi:MAG TPA: glycine zipper 2TM domain-containing protein [Rubrivivax sp.]
MDKSMVKGLAIGGIAMVVLGAGAVTGYQALNKPKFADVLAVKEAKVTSTTPREKCEQVQVSKQAPVKDERRVAGSVVGGVAGGLLGSQIGGGSGQKVATVAGAAAGAYAGNQVQKSMQEKDMVTTNETRCKTVNERTEKLVGYDVTYRLNGKEDSVRMAYNPGKQIPVRDGQLVLSAPEAVK